MKKKIFEIPNLDYSSQNLEINSINDENSEFNKLLESLASS
tara:strand:- start:2291 stop:2413 length:123 start_codon:yes stop_codon:yes gene_type:complete